jgi:O-antigen ligase
MQTRKRAAADRSPRLAGAERTALAVLAAGALVIPTIITSGSDPFRLPKELAFRAEAILLLAAAVFWMTSRKRTWRISRGPELVAAAAIVGWTLLTTATSTNRLLSADSLITVAAAAVIFIATCVAAQALSLVAVDVLMVGACANAALVILQETKLWTPLALTIQGHYASVGLLGNANDVGTFLVAPAIAAVVVAVAAPGARRWIYAFIALLLSAGVVASGTRAALGALVAGLIVFALLQARRAAVVVVAALAILALPLLTRSTTIGGGVREFIAAAKTRDYPRLLSERLVPFLAAADMVRDHPLVGVGPGCFRYHYMAYRVALTTHYPAAWTQGWPQNWAEVHNDHLQVASETGVPGYVLFLGAIGVAAGIGARRRAAGASPQAAFARAMRWPLAVSTFVICLAQFPLELAAPRLMLLSLAALCIAWDRDDAA